MEILAWAMFRIQWINHGSDQYTSLMVCQDEVSSQKALVFKAWFPAGVTIEHWLDHDGSNFINELVNPQTNFHQMGYWEMGPNWRKYDVGCPSVCYEWFITIG